MPARPCCVAHQFCVVLVSMQRRCTCRRGQAASLLCLLTVPHRLRSCTLPAQMPCARCLCWASWLAMVSVCRLLSAVTVQQPMHVHGCGQQKHWPFVTAGGSIVDAAATDVPASGTHPPTLRELMGILIAFHSLPAGKFSAVFVQMAAHTAPCKGIQHGTTTTFTTELRHRGLSKTTAF